ncbi:hypothetical protein LPJ61_004495 [Coemansia biformis]|uniref:Uncharacterized protein n=1 Tax=Coemansia biformis TaxID=1286918 RepID=A0A9W8CX72_9FUNG|nr:hypothetical protein LPJ61_004495 [Coemansia biformis]
MAAGRAKTASKVAALKHKLRAPSAATQRTAGKTARSQSTSKPGALAGRQQRARTLAKAVGAVDGFGIARASTKHSAGRKDLCRSLDRTVVGTQVGDALRGIGQPAAPTAAQIEQRARESRERAAQAYERQQAAVDETVDELARLMAGPA